MTFLYVLTKILTFPGVYVRGFWEQVVCRATRTVVEDNRYLRGDEMCSHIDHELIASPSGAFAMGFVPCFFNCIGIVFLSVFPYVFRPDSVSGSVFSTLSIWFVLSLSCNLFPSIEDALNMKDKVYGEGNILQKVLYAPFFAVLFIGAYLERYCITFVAALIAVFTIFAI